MEEAGIFLLNCIPAGFAVISRRILPLHQSLDAFRTAESENDTFNVFGGLNNWDSQHFLHIAIHGYKDEFSLAFFPAFPLILRFLCLVVPFCSLSTRSLQILAYILNGLTCACCVILFNCSPPYPLSIFSNSDSLSPLLFSINPATIFFTASYTEPLFLASTLMALKCLFDKHLILSSLCAAASCLLRSNGLVNCLLLQAPLAIISVSNGLSKNVIRSSLFVALVYVIPSLISFAVFQAFSYWTLCSSGSKAADLCKGYTTLPYSFIQKKYWNVGKPFAFWTARQIPNFMLAAPTVLFAVACLRNAMQWAFLHRDNLAPCAMCLVFSGHLAFMIFFAVVFMHVQVITRFLFSSCPILYWYADNSIRRTLSHSAFVELTEGRPCRAIKEMNPVLLYFTTYTVLGTVAFSIGLPWT